MEDFVSISNFAKEKNLKKTFWSRRKINKDCIDLSQRLKLPKLITHNKKVEYKRCVVSAIFYRMNAAKKERG